MVASQAERFLLAELAPHADASSAEVQRRYMKSELEFLGVSQRDVRAAARDFVRAHPELDRVALRAIAEHAFSTPRWDLRSAAIAVLERRRAELRANDLGWLVRLVRIAACWAHVDWLAAKVVPAALAHAELASTLRRWAGDDDVWVRRTALLAQLDALRGGDGDWPLFVEIAVPMLEERSFWIRKALGWVLREVGKRRPELVLAFLREHGDRCSGLTRREAEKYL